MNTFQFFQDVHLVGKTVYRIFATPLYFFLAALFTGIAIVIFIWLPNFGLIRDVIFSVDWSFADKMLFLWHSLGALKTNFTFLSATLGGIVAVLFGLNLGLTAFYFRRRVALQRASGLSISGVLLGLIGVGCASCGSVILSTFLSVGATASLLDFLPLRGQEFSFLSIGILLVAMFVSVKKIAYPLVCKVYLDRL